MPAKKDAEGNWTDRRLCRDFRKVNEHTQSDKYDMHRADDIFYHKMISTSPR